MMSWPSTRKTEVQALLDTFPSNTIPVSEEVFTCIRGAEGPLRGHRSCTRRQASQRGPLIAASAIGIDAALLFGDGIFHKVPVQGLTLL